MRELEAVAGLIQIVLCPELAMDGGHHVEGSGSPLTCERACIFQDFVVLMDQFHGERRVLRQVLDLGNQTPHIAFDEPSGGLEIGLGGLEIGPSGADSRYDQEGVGEMKAAADSPNAVGVLSISRAVPKVVNVPPLDDSFRIFDVCSR